VKIGAGGLQSQITEKAVKVRQVDSARNKPGHEEAIPANQVEGQDRAREPVLNRPPEKPQKDRAVDNHSAPRQQMSQQNEQEEPAEQLGRYVDVYV